MHVNQPGQTGALGKIDDISPRGCANVDTEHDAFIHHDGGVRNQLALADVKQLSTPDHGSGRQRGGTQNEEDGNAQAGFTPESFSMA